MVFPRVIISLTSYPARLRTLSQVLEPLFRQTVSADCIQLWLSEDEFESKNDIPESLHSLESVGLEIKWCPRSLKPHNKYFWAMQEHPDDIVITVDDDVLYPLGMIQSLLEMHYWHPRAVVSNRTHIVTYDDAGCIAPYQDWVFAQTSICGEPRADLLATGVGGVLYPPGIFDDEVFDEEKIRETSLMADDLWLMINELRLGVPVVSTCMHTDLVYVDGTQEGGLFVDNLVGGRNNEILETLFSRYPATEESLRCAIDKRETNRTVVSEADERGIARRLLHRAIGR